MQVTALKDCPSSYLAPATGLPPDEPDTRVPTPCAKLNDESHGVTHVSVDDVEWTDGEPGVCADWHDRYDLDYTAAQPEETGSEDAEPEAEDTPVTQVSLSA